MKKILHITLFVLCSCSAFAQIELNTLFNPLTNNPLDGREYIDNLADTTNITFKKEGLTTFANDVKQHWYWSGDKWIQLTSTPVLVAKTDSICIAQFVLGLADTTCVFSNPQPSFEQLTTSAGSTVTTTIDLQDLTTLTDDEIDEQLKVHRNGILISHGKHYNIQSQFVIETLGDSTYSKVTTTINELGTNVFTTHPQDSSTIVNEMFDNEVAVARRRVTKSQIDLLEFEAIVKEAEKEITDFFDVRINDICRAKYQRPLAGQYLLRV